MFGGNDQVKTALKKEEFGLCRLGKRREKGRLVCALGNRGAGREEFS